MMDEKKSKWTFGNEILPKNDNTAKLIKQREEQEAARKAKEDALRVTKEKEATERKRRERENAKDQEKQKKQLIEQQRKEREEADAASSLTGRLLFFLKSAKDNETPREYSMSGIELGPARTGILSKVIAYNTTLTTLHLSRKNIEDTAGVEIARILHTNTTLRKLELEFNRLGPMTAKELGIALMRNKTLRFLDLESNQLTQEGEDPNGLLKFFIPAMRQNKHLLSLNIGNNKLDDLIGKECDDFLDENLTLIDFEFGFNAFTLNQVRSIQEKLLRNNRKYQAERLQEWRERKAMRYEDQKLTEMYLDESTRREQARMEDENKEHREREIDQQWKKYFEEKSEEKKQVILQLAEAAELRNTRGKRRGKKRGGKKGKKK